MASFGDYDWKDDQQGSSSQTRVKVPTPQSGGVTIIVAAIKSIVASLVAQCTFAGTGGLWFLAGILVGSSLGVLFAAIARLGCDRE
jgi:hypothetical protein